MVLSYVGGMVEFGSVKYSYVNGVLELNYVDAVMVLSYSTAHDVIGIIR